MDIMFIQNNVYLFAAIAVWEFIWKGMAMWKAAKRNQRYWFAGLLVINTVGVLPIVYMLLYRNHK